MALRHHFMFWIFATLGLLGGLFVFQSVLLPFVVGAVVAYLLNPLVNKLGAYSISRGMAALLIIGGFFVVLSVLMVVLSPLAYRQSLQFIEDFPGYVDQVFETVQPLIAQVMHAMGQSGDLDIRALLQANDKSVLGALAKVLGGVVASGQAAFDVVSLFVFAPLVSYFLVKAWPQIVKWVEDMLPRDNKHTIEDLLKQIDVKISGFIRGQISVAAILGTMYAVALTIAGLKYGFLIGLGAGLLSVIPMVGSVVGLIVAVGVAWFQAGDIMFVGIIAAIFLIGQVIEGNFLTPKLVGDSVGLHPLWVFFALLAGGSLFGILGMFLAVPVAAVAGVLLVFAIGRYKASAYYKASPKPKKTAAKKMPAKKSAAKKVQKTDA